MTSKKQQDCSFFEDLDSSNHYVEQGNTMVDMDILTSIDISDGWVEASSLQCSECPLLITDASMSANKNGTFRFCMSGVPIKEIYYTAKTYISIHRNLPYFLPTNVKMSLEFKTEEDGASISTCIGGLKNVTN